MIKIKRRGMFFRIWIVQSVGFHVPPLLHYLNLFLIPDIERERFHTADMGANSAMQTCALYADEYPERTRGPSWLGRITNLTINKSYDRIT